MVQDPLLEGSLGLLRKCKVQDPLLEGPLGLFKKCKVQDPLLEGWLGLQALQLGGDMVILEQ